VNGETALIEAARGGSAAAFTQLVEAYRGRLLRFLMTRSASFADAEDALQDTLVNAYRYLPSYDSRWRFSTWLYRIAVNNAAKIRAVGTQELGDAAMHSESGSDRENLWLTARRLLSDEVYCAMWLRYVEDMSVTDISAVLDRSVSWTKVNLMRGRRSLELELNNDDDMGEVYG